MVSVAPVSQPQTWHLNLKWSIADTDVMLKMARGGLGPMEIARRFRNAGRACTADEVERILADAGITYGGAA